MRRLSIPTLALGGLVMSGTVVHAAASSERPTRDTSFSVEVFAGGHHFGPDTNLGVASAPDATAGGKSNAVTGVRAGVGLSSWSSLEIELLGMLTADRTYHRRAGLLGYRLNLLAFLLPGNLRPYLLVGAGALEVVTTRADGAAGMVRDRDGEFHVGGGVDYRLRDHFGLRLDARAVQMPGKQSASLSADIEATLSAVFPFGAGPRVVAAPPGRAEPPPSPPATVVAPRVAPPAAEADAAPSTQNASVPAPTAVVPPAAEDVATDAPEPSPAVSEPSAPGAPVVTAPAPSTVPRPTPTVPTPTVTPGSPAAPVVSPAPARTPLPSIKELLPRAKEIRFDGASNKLSLVSLPFIGQLAEALVRDSSLELEIVAHVAGTGDAGKDLASSKRRAEAVKRALVEREVPPSRLVVTGRGSEDPLAPNITRSGRKLNERVELKLLVPDKVTR